MTRNITIDDVNVTTISEEHIPTQVVRAYMQYAEKECKRGEKLNWIKIVLDPKDPDNASLDYGILPPKFSRIRRVTGYLVGDMDRWNDAKRHEEHDRLKHIVA